MQYPSLPSKRGDMADGQWDLRVHWGALLSGWASGHLEWRSGYENKEKQTLEPLYCPSVKQSLSQRVFITYYVSVITTSTDQKTWCEVVRISSDWVRGHFQPRDRIICKNPLIIYSKEYKFFQRNEVFSFQVQTSHRLEVLKVISRTFWRKQKSKRVRPYSRYTH